MQAAGGELQVFGKQTAPRGPVTILLVTAGFIAFATASVMLFDAYDDRHRDVYDQQSQYVSAEQSRAVEEQSRAVEEQSRAVEERYDAEMHRLAAEQRLAEDRVAESILRREQAEREAAAVRDVLVRAERDLGTIQERTGALKNLVSEQLPVERREETIARFETLRNMIAEARADVRAGSGLAREPVLRQAPAELMLAMAEPPSVGPSPTMMAWTKLYIVLGMFSVLSVAFLAAVFAIFTTSRPAVLAFAMDTVKTMLGFFIGVVTAFMSAP